MPRNIYFIVHGKEDLEKHPNVLGLLVKVDKNGAPLLDEHGNFIPVSSKTEDIKRGDLVVYYTLGDCMIKGIFEIAREKLGKNDRRRVKEWKRGQIQFIIKPVLKPDEGVDLRELIQKLNLFNHLKNPEKDYRGSIRGKNYVRNLDSHDFGIIKKALQSRDKGKPIRTRAYPPRSQTMARKYGSYGEGQEHKMLKKWVASHPESIGITNVRKVIVEHIFISGDAADIVFEIPENRYVVVEIETNFPLPGCYQALKYRVLKCAEMGRNIACSNVEAVLVARTLPLNVKNICSKYGIRPVLIQT